jgi:hypothetical protein
VPIPFLIKKTVGVDVQELIDEGISSLDTDLKGDSIKNVEAIQTGEAEKIKEI